MRPSFNWQTEEQENDDWAAAPPSRPASSKRGSRTLFFVLGVIMLTAAAAALYLNHRQHEAITRITQDVTAVFATSQQAITRQDAELYAQLLSSQDRAWYTAQRRLFAAGLPQDRASLGLQFVPTAVPVPAVDLSPNLRQAEVTFDVPYTAVSALGVASPIRLEQTVVYRQQNSRWLQNPPDAGFWGETTSSEMGLLSLTYPGRDTEIVLRLGRDLAAELTALCAELAGGACPPHLRVPLEFSTDPASLADLSDLTTPAWNGRVYHLPAPTLIGLPTDEASYQALYRGLTRRIVANFRTRLFTPIPLPDQTLQTLCYAPEALGLRLYTYDLDQDAWTAVLPQTALRTLAPLPNDQGIVVQELPPAQEPTRLHLTAVQGTATVDLLNEADMPGNLHPIGWSAAADHARLILQGTDARTAAFYRWLDVAACQSGVCQPQAVNGYPVWSPDGRYTVLVDGSDLYLGDGEGQIQQPLGEGFSPFWLDGQTYGYIRFAQAAGEASVGVVAGRVGSAEQEILFTNIDLQAALPRAATAVFPKYISPNPADSHNLIIGASGIGELAGKYYIFTYEANGDITLHLQLHGTPNGNPAWLTPLGNPPFQVSPDGRWLILSKLRDTWTFTLHDLAQNESQLLTTHYPPYPMRFPYYDWSGDGRWLVIADDGFLRLLAPDYDYERLIPYDFDACLFAAWSNSR
ncbi:MAG: hypothetical protein KC441_12315 [Anaerolineales bacterium]|nr:hypothetical protein [Anaerolineales bacterium]